VLAISETSVKIIIRLGDGPTFFWSDSITITRVSVPRGLTRTQTPLCNKKWHSYLSPRFKYPLQHYLHTFRQH
jgi:hypothetical protein